MGWFAEFFPDNPRNPVALAQNTFRQEADSSSETWVAASCMAHGSKESFSRIRIPNPLHSGIILWCYDHSPILANTEPPSLHF